jgi:hypothetical protein
METLSHHKRFDKASKCKFGCSSASFLGHVISQPEAGVCMDCLPLTNERMQRRARMCGIVCSFIGLANSAGT